jgi:hypothetical protein
MNTTVAGLEPSLITQTGTMVDLRTAFDIAISLLAFFGGWMVKTLFDRIDKLEKADNAMTKALNDLRVELPSHYVDKDSFNRVSSEMLASLRRIEDRLATKADKQ